MYQPESYWVSLLFVVVSMLCWGSWANTRKLSPGYAFQLFYWDFVFGLLLSALLWGVTLGNIGGGKDSFFANMHSADWRHILLAIAGGAVFNVANLRLVAAIEIAGLAVAFPVGIGLGLIVGVILNYTISPRGNPVLLFGGMLLVVLAIITDALAYFRRDDLRQSTSRQGIWISIVCGVLMGLFYPLVAKACAGPGSLGPYTVAVWFGAGVLLCALPVNFLFMRKPLTGTPPVSVSEYFRQKLSWHFWGAMGGAICSTGTLFNFVASHGAIVGPAVSFALGQGATMISACWGVFAWKEFADAPAASRKLIPAMFVFFLLGLGAIAVAPVVAW